MNKLILLLLFFSSFASAQSLEINHDSFRKLTGTLETLFDKEFKKIGKKLVLDLKVNDPNNMLDKAEATVDGRKAIVTLYGGLPLIHDLNIDGLAAILCHEIGHHIGGAPKRPGYEWSSAEGQADYWSASKCLKRLFKNEDNESVLSLLSVPSEVTSACDQFHPSKEDRLLCQRIAMAGYNKIQIIKALKHKLETINFTTPPTVHGSLVFNDPSLKCRLFTYLAGALCDKSDDEMASQKDPSVGFCKQDLKLIQAGRPACWYGKE